MYTGKEVEFVSRQPLKVLHATFFFRCVTSRYIDWQSRLLAWYNFAISLSGRNLESVNLFKLFSAESCTELDYVKRESFFTVNKESMTSECKIQFSQPWAINCISFRLFICLSSAHETFAKHWVLVQKGLLIILLTAFIWNDPHRVKGVKLSRSIAFACITRSKMAWFLARKKKNIYWDRTVVWFLTFHAAFTKNKGTLLSQTDWKTNRYFLYFHAFVVVSNVRHIGNHKWGVKPQESNWIVWFCLLRSSS